MHSRAESKIDIFVGPKTGTDFFKFQTVFHRYILVYEQSKVSTRSPIENNKGNEVGFWS
jgi:hypothetical protein